MPFRKKKLTKRRRRPFRRSMARYSPGPQKSLPLGKSFKFQTRYIETALSLDPTAGTPTTYVYSLSGLYDPDISSGGHQPIGFDQLMAMYDHYHVIGAKYRVTFSATDTTNQSIVACQIKDTDTTTNNLYDIIENGMTKYSTLGVESSGASTKTITGGISTSKFFGRSVMDGSKYNGTATSNPNDQVYLHILAAPADGLSNIAPVLATVQIDYIAILTEPKQLVGS